jgi:uncharacterized protein (DUF4415 family)
MTIKLSSKSIVMPSLEKDLRITAAAQADPDAQPLTAKQLKAMVPLRTLRGRPKSDNAKQLLSLRYSPEVLTYFRSTGDGWQARMNEVLLKHVRQQGGV